MVAGSLERVDCAAGRMTLVLRDAAKKLSRVSLPVDAAKLKVRGETGASFVCGAMAKPVMLKVTYARPPKAGQGTLGDATVIEFVHRSGEGGPGGPPN